MLDNIKTLLGIAYDDYSKDNLILLLIEQEKDYAFNYTNNTVDNNFLITKMVVYKYNRLGTEGLKSENYSGASYNYTDDYPSDIIKSLNTYRKLKVL